MEKEKTQTLTVRLPESKVKLIEMMANALGISKNKLASTMLEAGFVIVDAVKVNGADNLLDELDKKLDL